MKFNDLFSRIGFKPVKSGIRPFFSTKKKSKTSNSTSQLHSFQGPPEVVIDGIPSAGISGKVLKSGKASRVLFLYPGDYGSFIEDVHVTLIDGGLVHVQGAHEESTVHMQNCEIIWYMEPPTEDPDGTPEGYCDGNSGDKSTTAIEKVIPFRKRQRHS